MGKNRAKKNGTTPAAAPTKEYAPAPSTSGTVVDKRAMVAKCPFLLDDWTHRARGDIDDAPFRPIEHPRTSVYSVADFLTPTECVNIIHFAESYGFEEVFVKETKHLAKRHNGRILVRSEQFAVRLWQRCQHVPIVPALLDGCWRACGMNPDIRIYRYMRGQNFGLHYDEHVLIGADAEKKGGTPRQQTMFTCLVYLSDDGTVTGGETKFYSKGKLVLALKPVRGMACFHGHGDDGMEHEGAEVLNGVKYCLRSDVVYERDEH